MLQQTQVSVVIPYFKRWILKFPTIKDLANSQEEDVVKLWEGLGYYSRARSLLKGAQYVVEHFGGDLPSTRQSLESIPGIGPYTAGAILSFAFHQRAEALDGNVIRILTRYLAYDGEISSTRTLKDLRSTLYNILGDDQPWITMEGLIELGALVCKKSPLCQQCPIQKGCKARKNNSQQHFPVKKAKPKTIQIERYVFCLFKEDKIFVQKGKQKLMNGLYNFPFLEHCDSDQDLETLVHTQWGLKAIHIESFKSIAHGFTKYRCTLFPSLWKVINDTALPEGEWMTFDQLHQIPFQGGHREIKQRLVDNRKTFYTANHKIFIESNL